MFANGLQPISVFTRGHLSCKYKLLDGTQICLEACELTELAAEGVGPCYWPNIHSI